MTRKGSFLQVSGFQNVYDVRYRRVYRRNCFFFTSTWLIPSVPRYVFITSLVKTRRFCPSLFVPSVIPVTKGLLPEIAMHDNAAGVTVTPNVTWPCEYVRETKGGSLWGKRTVIEMLLHHLKCISRGISIFFNTYSFQDDERSIYFFFFKAKLYFFCARMR